MIFWITWCNSKKLLGLGFIRIANIELIFFFWEFLSSLYWAFRLEIISCIFTFSRILLYLSVKFCEFLHLALTHFCLNLFVGFCYYCDLIYFLLEFPSGYCWHVRKLLCFIYLFFNRWPYWTLLSVLQSFCIDVLGFLGIQSYH